MCVELKIVVLGSGPKTRTDRIIQVGFIPDLEIPGTDFVDPEVVDQVLGQSAN